MHFRRTRRAGESIRVRAPDAGPRDGGQSPARARRRRRLSHGVSRRHQGRDHSGRGQRAAHSERLRAHARGQPGPGSDRLGAPGAAIRPPHRQAAVSQERDHFRRARPGSHDPRGDPGEWLAGHGSCSDHVGRRLLLVLLFGLDRSAEGGGPRALEHGVRSGALRQVRARGHRAGHSLLVGEAVLRLRPGECPDLHPGRRRDRRADGRAPDAGIGIQATGREEADHLLRRADAIRFDARQPRAAEQERARLARVRVRRRGAARRPRPALEGEERESTSWKGSGRRR